MKRFFSILTAFIVFFCFFIPVSASNNSFDGDYYKIITIGSYGLNNFGTWTYWAQDDVGSDNMSSVDDLNPDINIFYPRGYGMNSSNAVSAFVQHLPVGTNQVGNGGNGLADSATEFQFNLYTAFYGLIEYATVDAAFGSNGLITHSSEDLGTYLRITPIWNNPQVNFSSSSYWSNDDTITLAGTKGIFDLGGTVKYNLPVQPHDFKAGDYYLTNIRFEVSATYPRGDTDNHQSYFALSNVRLYVKANRYQDIVDAIESVGGKVDDLNQTVKDSTDRVIGSIEDFREDMHNVPPAVSESVDSQNESLSSIKDEFSNYDSEVGAVTLSPEHSEQIDSAFGMIEDVGEDVSSSFDNPVGSPFAFFPLIFSSPSFDLGFVGSWQTWCVLLVFAFALVSVLLYGRSGD